MGSVKYPTLDFFDPNSLATWLEAKNIAQEMGMRFNHRLDHVTGVIMVLSSILMMFTLLYVGGFLHAFSGTSTEQLVQFFVITFILHVYCFRMIIPIAYINQETVNQIKKLLKIRSVIFRFVINPEHLLLN